MPLTIVTGDILNSTEQFIVQQNCCTAVRAHGLSATIAAAMPGCDPYASRKPYKGNWAVLEDRPEPGSLMIFEREEGGPSVICAFAQYCHGKPGVAKDPLSASARSRRWLWGPFPLFQGVPGIDSRVEAGIGSVSLQDWMWSGRRLVVSL